MGEARGALLLRGGLVHAPELARAAALEQEGAGSLDECLVALGVVTELQLAEFYHRRLMVPLLAEVELAGATPRALALVPADMAVEFRVLPIALDADGLTLAMADPSDNHAVDEVAFFANCFVVRAVAAQGVIRRALERHYGVRIGPAPIAAPAPAPVAAPAPAPIAAPAPVAIPTPAPVVARKPRVKQPATPSLPEPPLAALRGAADRDAVVSAVLDYVAHLARRSVFFVVKRSQLAGHDARGSFLDAAVARRLSFSLEAPSLLRDVVAARLPYRGPLTTTPADRAFATALGGIGPEILLMPIAVRDRLIAVLFADGLRAPLPEPALHATAREAGLAYERLILAAKGR